MGAEQQLIEEIVGEVNYHNHIKNFELEQLPQELQNEIPLYELPKFVDRLKNIKLGRGRMV